MLLHAIPSEPEVRTHQGLNDGIVCPVRFVGHFAPTLIAEHGDLVHVAESYEDRHQQLEHPITRKGGQNDVQIVRGN